MQTDSSAGIARSNGSESDPPAIRDAVARCVASWEERPWRLARQTIDVSDLSKDTTEGSEGTSPPPMTNRPSCEPIEELAGQTTTGRARHAAIAIRQATKPVEIRFIVLRAIICARRPGEATSRKHVGQQAVMTTVLDRARPLQQRSLRNTGFFGITIRAESA